MSLRQNKQNICRFISCFQEVVCVQIFIYRAAEHTIYVIQYVKPLDTPLYDTHTWKYLDTFGATSAFSNPNANLHTWYTVCHLCTQHSQILNAQIKKVKSTLQPDFHTGYRTYKNTVKTGVHHSFSHRSDIKSFC